MKLYNLIHIRSSHINLGQGALEDIGQTSYHAPASENGMVFVINLCAKKIKIVKSMKNFRLIALNFTI